ncbi:MAG: hypothetical protein C4526_05720 [Nitrospiraceae bacterium]|nr:MAG: hypothetical protein C4526_05720 [Nitrospiraceae bacterium]
MTKKSDILRCAFICIIASLILSLSTKVFAADLPVDGNLTVTGDAIIQSGSMGSEKIINTDDRTFALGVGNWVISNYGTSNATFAWESGNIAGHTGCGKYTAGTIPGVFYAKLTAPYLNSVTPGKKYKVSADFYRPAGTSNINFRFYLSAINEKLPIDVTNIPTDIWTTYTGYFVADSDWSISYVSVAPSIYGSAAGETFFIDNISITEVAGGNLSVENWITGIGGTSGIKVDSSGNVGIGIAPSKKFHVAGDIQVDGNINAKYQDLAEWVRTSTPISKGTVVMIDTKQVNQVIPSYKAYSTLVAGVVSETPGIVLGEGGADKAIIAHTGRVNVKVDSNYGKISVGDLLVTSPVEGYAMKADSDKLKPGMLLGKALEALDEGKGEILVLLTLQ